MKRELEIDESSPLFMRWFDCQMDRLLGTVQTYRAVPECSSDHPFGIEFPGEGDSILTWALVPCTYWYYRQSGPNYNATDEDFSKRFPLTVNLQAFRELDTQKVFHQTPYAATLYPCWYTEYFFPDIRPLPDTAPLKTVPETSVITLKWIPYKAQVKLTIVYELNETDPLLWLLRAIIDEYGKVRSQLIQKYRDHLKDLISRASEAEQAEWEALDWVTNALNTNAVETAVSNRSVEGKPWEQIPEHNWDRRALELWCGGYTCPEIGHQLSLSQATVRNRLTALRGQYGENIVPTLDQLRKKKIR